VSKATRQRIGERAGLSLCVLNVMRKFRGGEPGKKEKAHHRGRRKGETEKRWYKTTSDAKQAWYLLEQVREKRRLKEARKEKKKSGSTCS